MPGGANVSDRVGSVHVARIGLTPVKGGRHRTHGSVALTPTGPQGDRAFCLVDPATHRCLRTVENPTLLQTRASWDGTLLSVELPAGRVVGEPVTTGRLRTVDYWGRRTGVEVVEGPWAAAYSAHLGREVELAATGPGDVVYGGAVTLVTSASLHGLAEQVAAAVEGARFRATLELGTDDLAPHEEERWVGRRVRVGAAELRVLGPVPRCAVVDLHPASGVRDLALMKALASRPAGGVGVFGVDAEVVAPGLVTQGDAAALVPRLPGDPPG